MNVLSLFDGMSCGQLALKRAGISYDNYYASEIDKHAIKVTMANFPNTIQLGDITKVSGYDLPKIDLLIGGSPCQGFSFAGKMLNFDDPRSKLFFEYVRILHECREKNPDIVYLLENVRMKKEAELVITQALNVYPIEINSALVSAQSRRRLYWTNINSTHTDLFGCMIPGIEEPEDRGLFLKDIIEPEVNSKYYLTEKQIESMIKRTEKNKARGTKFKFVPKEITQKANTIENEGRQDMEATYVFADYRSDEGLRIRRSGKTGTVNARAREDVYGAGLVITHNLPRRMGKGKGGKGHLQKTDGKSYSVDTQNRQAVELLCGRIRRLSPIECERLQTIPDNFTNHVSEAQRYKMIGNGWTIDVIVHLLRHWEFKT